ncbi:MAG: hypothetical protein V3V14_10760 [Saprospiraceae bacterium]
MDNKNKKISVLSTIGFLMFIIGFVSIVLSLVGLQFSLLSFLNVFGQGSAFVIKLLMLFVGLIIVYVVKMPVEND